MKQTAKKDTKRCPFTGSEDIFLDLFEVFPEFLCLNINGKSGAKNVFLYNPDSRCREPLNNSLCPVSARCISRNLHLVKAISVQNGHYFSAFLLLFLKKGRLPPYQVAESFRPAMASAYKLAQANIAYSRFSFFFKPRYTVFL